MKPHKLLFILAMLISGILAYAQNTTVYVSGHVKDIVTSQPIANHLVSAHCTPNQPFPDSAQAITNQEGYYTLSLEVPYVSGAVTFFNVGTQDCNGAWIMQTLTASPSTVQTTAEFTICSDTMPPPSPCANFIMVNSVMSLTVSFHGATYSGTPASYLWLFGDGATATGENVTHTYPQPDIYIASLQTTTTNGCSYTSTYTVMLDSTPPPSNCQNEIHIDSLQGLHVRFHGHINPPQAASYYWDLGDNTTKTGEIVSHTYAQNGFYMITLHTYTLDSCESYSTYPLYLGDSTNTGCSSYIVWNPTTQPGLIEFEAITPTAMPAQFVWDFGDGSTVCSGQFTNHFYPTPGTYNVVLTTSMNNCSSTSQATVVVYPDSTGNLTIGGQVFAGNAVLQHGNVTLFETDPNVGFFYPVANAYIDSTGHYHFWNIGTGTYLVLAEPAPDSLILDHFLPTFYGDVVFWEQATPIVLGVPLNPYDIHLVNFDSICCGAGSVIGQIIGGGKSMGQSGQEVLLLDQAGNVVRITYTDAQGSFSFTNLPFGQYTVSPMVTGTTTVPVPLALSQTNPSAHVTMTIAGHLITGLINYQQAGAIEKVYPNPAVDHINVSVKKEGLVNIQIMDAIGKSVQSENVTINSVGQLVNLNVSDLKNGLYFVVIRDKDGNTSSRQFMKN